MSSSFRGVSNETKKSPPPSEDYEAPSFFQTPPGQLTIIATIAAISSAAIMMLSRILRNR